MLRWVRHWRHTPQGISWGSVSRSPPTSTFPVGTISGLRSARAGLVSRRPGLSSRLPSSARRNTSSLGGSPCLMTRRPDDPSALSSPRCGGAAVRAALERLGEEAFRPPDAPLRGGASVALSGAVNLDATAQAGLFLKRLGRLALAVVPASPRTLYVTTPIGIYESTDAAAPGH